MLEYTRNGRNIANLLKPYLRAGFELHARWLLVTGGSARQRKQTVESLESALDAKFDYAFVKEKNPPRRPNPVWWRGGDEFVEIRPDLQTLNKKKQAAAAAAVAATASTAAAAAADQLHAAPVVVVADAVVADLMAHIAAHRLSPEQKKQLVSSLLA